MRKTGILLQKENTKVNPLSKRKLESYKRAEMLARECRFQCYDYRNLDLERLVDFVIYWMNSTGNIKYERPKKRKT